MLLNAYGYLGYFIKGVEREIHFLAPTKHKPQSIGVNVHPAQNSLIIVYIALSACIHLITNCKFGETNT